MPLWQWPQIQTLLWSKLITGQEVPVWIGPECYAQGGAVPEPEREEMYSYKDLPFLTKTYISYT